MPTIAKKFSIKVYQPDGTTFVKTISPDLLKNDPSFVSQTSGGFGSCSLDFQFPFDDFEEGTTIDYMNIFKIYQHDADNVAGRLIYTGFVSEYTPYFSGSEQGVSVTLLGLVSLLALSYYKNGASFDVTHTGVDPSAIMKLIVDHHVSIYTAALITYTGVTVDLSGTVATYTFTQKKWIDALKDAFALIPAGWWWTIDKTGVLYVKQKPATATHTFTVGKDLVSANIRKSSESVVNAVTLAYSGGSVNASDATSITNFGRRERYISDTATTDATTATTAATKEVNDNKAERIKASLEINSLYDLETIKVGDTCKIRNLKAGSTVFGENMLIVAVRYTPDKVTLDLEEIAADFGVEMTRFIS